MKGPGAEAWWALAAAALWVPLAARLSPAWGADPEMIHGWAVPAFALYLAWDRRDAAPSVRSPSGIEARAWGLLALLCSTVVAASLPLLEANPTWPKPAWGAVLAAAGATLAGLALRGGARRAAWFAAPVLFAVAALPWPSGPRSAITLGLADINAVAAAELVSAAGSPAVVKGRVIELANGTVGVDEACSGVRSLQTVTMVAWFFTVLLRLGWARAAGFIAASFAVALAVNLARTCWLTWTAAKEGIAAMDALHDRAGQTGFFVTLGGVAFLAWLWSRMKPEAAAPGGAEASEKTREPEAGPKLPAQRVAPTVWPVWAVVALMATAEASTRVWYARGAGDGTETGWEFVSGSGARAWEVPEAAREQLGYSEGGGRYLAENGGERRWLAFVFRWDASEAVKASVFGHDPTICLPAIGSALEAELGPVEVVWPERRLTLDGFRFRGEGRVQHVFYALWDARAGREVDREAERADPSQRRMRQVREGRRRVELSQVIVALEGAAGDAEAKAELQRMLPELIKPWTTGRD